MPRFRLVDHTAQPDERLGQARFGQCLVDPEMRCDLVQRHVLESVQNEERRGIRAAVAGSLAPEHDARPVLRPACALARIGTSQGSWPYLSFDPDGSLDEVQKATDHSVGDLGR
ncbi:MAG: hypothetical protein U1E24_00930, partial [Phenylobacterium sp.]|nr:hypothetical protein [Phenylobacterium sp.]